MGLRYWDLGPVCLDRDGVLVKVPAGRLTAVLSVLLVQANHRVSTDSLLDALWGERLRDQNAQTLESHLWRLRKLLEPQHRAGQPYSTLLHNAHGYQLLAATDQVDSLWFVQLAGQARDLMVSDQPERALSRCEQALGLWRGRPWAPQSDAEWAAPAAARLEELRGDVAYQRVDALLALGQLPLALADLETLIGETPLRERLWGQRMLGLYRAGRVDDALQAYQRLRGLLIDELGVEPGPDIQSLHARILADDPHLTPSTTSGPTSEMSVDQPHSPANAPEDAVRLPHRRTSLIGRETHTANVVALITDHRLVSVVGSAGCGKTSIAVEAARQAVVRFPDGVVFVDLSAATEQDQLLDAVSAALRLRGSAAETLTQSLVAFTRTRRMLLLLDNCEQLLEAVADLADALLGIDTELSILTTSRQPLNLDDEHIFDLPPLAVMDDPHTRIADIQTLADQAAVQLFLTRLRAAAPEVEIGEAETRLAARICAAVDGVPLAIELAAAQARAYTLTEVIDRVQDDLAGLARIGRGANRHHGSLRAAIDLSSATLSKDELAMHHALSVVPGPVTPTLAAALVDQPQPAATLTLSRLVHRSMLTVVPPDRPDRPSRFAQLATIRSHAHSGLARDQRTELETRRDAWVAHLIAQSPRESRNHLRAWIKRVDDDTTAVRATLQRRLVDDPTGDGDFLAARLYPYWIDQGMNTEWERWTRLADARSAGSDRFDHLYNRFSHATAVAMMGRTDYLVDALEAIDPDRKNFTRAEKLALGDAVFSSVAAAQASGDAAVALHGEAIGRRLAEQTGDPGLVLLADAFELSNGLLTGHVDPASAQQRVRTLWQAAHDADNTYLSWIIASWGAYAAILSNDPNLALLWSTRVLADYRGTGIGLLSVILETRAAALTLNGLHEQAVQVYSASRSYARRTGFPWPGWPMTPTLFAVAANALSRQEGEQAERAGSQLSIDDIVHDPALAVRDTQT